MTAATSVAPSTSLPEPFSPSRRLGIGRELGDSPRNMSKVSRMGWSLKVACVLNLVRRCTLLKLYRLCEHPSALGRCAETDVLGVDVPNSGPLPYGADLERLARPGLLPVSQYPRHYFQSQHDWQQSVQDTSNQSR